MTVCFGGLRDLDDCCICWVRVSVMFGFGGLRGLSDGRFSSVTRFQ